MSPEEESVSLTRYALWFAGTSLIVVAIVIGVQVGFGIRLGSAFVPILPAMVAAMVEGSRYAKSTRTPLKSPWMDALRLSAIALAINFFLVAATLAAAPMAAVGISGIAILMAVYFVFWFITNRVFLAMGARNEWAAQDRKKG